MRKFAFYWPLSTDAKRYRVEPIPITQCIKNILRHLYDKQGSNSDTRIWLVLKLFSVFLLVIRCVTFRKLQKKLSYLLPWPTKDDFWIKLSGGRNVRYSKNTLVEIRLVNIWIFSGEWMGQCSSVQQNCYLVSTSPHIEDNWNISYT